MQPLIFQDVAVILLLSVGVLFLCHRLHIPSLVGFLITGIAAGPDGLKLVGTTENVKVLAETGVILLLFSIGMNFSIRKLFDLKRFFFIGGPLQVLLTASIGFLAAQVIGRPFGESIFLGWLISLSSTAIVLTLLEEKKELSTPQGNVATSVLIFQDVAAVLMILSTHFLVGEKSIVFSPEIFVDLGKGLLLLIFVFFASEKMVPWLLYHVVRTRIRELFLFTVLSLCFAVAWLASFVGLSLSIGAFLAGLTISETEYSNEAVGDIRPLQALFTSFFFISIGMLLDFDFVIRYPMLIFLLAAGVIFLKIVVCFLAMIFIGLPIRIAVTVGFFLAQVGEFSFVLVESGIAAGIGTDYHYQLFLAVALLTMLVSPLLIALAPHVGRYISQWKYWPEKIKTGITTFPKGSIPLFDRAHVIIVGYGPCGEYLARACRIAQEPYAILEMDPHIVRREKRKGEKIFFGDATHENVLHSVHIQDAGVLAVLVDELAVAQCLVRMARQINPKLYIVVRMRSMEKMKMMLDLGADDVIPDEFGTSVEIFTRVMKHCHVPDEEISAFVNEIREEGYEILRPLHQKRFLADINLVSTELEIEAFRIREGSFLCGKSLEEASFQRTHRIHVVMVKRKGVVFSQLDPSLVLEERDILIVVGTKERLREFAEYLYQS